MKDTEDGERAFCYKTFHIERGGKGRKKLKWGRRRKCSVCVVGRGEEMTARGNVDSRVYKVYN